MSRATGGQVIEIKPTNNIYTALAGAAVALQIVGLLVLFLTARSLFDGGLLDSKSPSAGVSSSRR
jgi:hypothetical protein